MRTHRNQTRCVARCVPRERRGFTLIELLIVVVIIAILAAIAIPKFASTKGKAEATALREDLRNLATAQEAYFYDYAVYATGTPLLSYSPSPGVTVTISTADATGWSAVATHPAATPGTCAVFYGGVAPTAPATIEGTIACQ
jgi:prepilin-type N-terminal cleavage/methylation domain-containing protein